MGQSCYSNANIQLNNGELQPLSSNSPHYGDLEMDYSNNRIILDIIDLDTNSPSKVIIPYIHTNHLIEWNIDQLIHPYFVNYDLGCLCYGRKKGDYQKRPILILNTSATDSNNLKEWIDSLHSLIEFNLNFIRIEEIILKNETLIVTFEECIPLKHFLKSMNHQNEKFLKVFVKSEFKSLLISLNKIIECETSYKEISTHNIWYSQSEEKLKFGIIPGIRIDKNQNSSSWNSLNVDFKYLTPELKKIKNLNPYQKTASYSIRNLQNYSLSETIKEISNCFTNKISSFVEISNKIRNSNKNLCFQMSHMIKPKPFEKQDLFTRTNLHSSFSQSHHSSKSISRLDNSIELNLSQIYMVLGQYHDSLEHSLRIKVSDDDSPNVKLEIYSLIARIYHRFHKSTFAFEYLRKVAELRIGMYEDNGNIEELEEAVEICEEVNIESALYLKAKLELMISRDHYSKGKYDECLSHLTIASESFSYSRGNHSQEYLCSLLFESQVFLKKGEFDDAEERASEAYEIIKNYYPKTDRYIWCRVLCTLSDVLRSKDFTDEANFVLDEAFEMFRKCIDYDKPEIHFVMDCAGYSKIENLEPFEALEHFQLSFDLFQTSRKKFNSEVCDIWEKIFIYDQKHYLLNKIISYYHSKDFPSANQLIQKLQSISANDFIISEIAIGYHGLCLLERGEFKKCKDFIRRGCEIDKSNKDFAKKFNVINNYEKL